MVRRIRGDDVRARPGQISPVVETAFGYHIIRVDRVQAAEVKARHILIVPEIDSADVAGRGSKQIRGEAQWRRGASYDSLVVKHHDATEEKGVLQPFARDSLPASYRTALTGAKAGDITSPFQLVNPSGAPKFAVIQVVTVTDAGEYDRERRSGIRFAPSSPTRARDQGSCSMILRKQTYVSLGCRK